MARLKAKSPEQSVRSKPKVLIYGKSGVGKTWGTLDFPGCYYIDTEGGAKEPEYIAKLKSSGGVYLGPEDGALDFTEVVGQFQALATEKHNYKTVIVDSITKLYQTQISLDQKPDVINDFGASKKPAIAQMRRLINWVDRMDMNVIFVAHSTDEWGLVNGQRQMTGSTFDAWPKLEFELHLALCIEKAGPRRTMKVRKSRIAGFPEGQTFDWSYEKFVELYGREIVEGNVTQVSLASADQVAELTRLVDIMKIDQAEVDKWLTKASADSLAELSSDQVDKTITFLKGRLAA